MTFTVEQKSQLAKLMATENLTIQHQKVPTAFFDTKNRVLVLPIWQNMTGSLYDLLAGHEVGHAHYTPPEGWHDAVADKSKGRNYKSFLNVVEDARIEKKIKRRYPGLNNSFHLGYRYLFDNDFFGIRNKNVNDLPFIDRLNIYTKSQYTMDVQFSSNEQLLVKKVQAIETWEDVLRVTDEIYAYSKEEQSEMEEFDSHGFGQSDDYDDEESDFGYGMGDPDEYGEEEYDDESSSESEDGDDTDEEDGDDEGDSENTNPDTANSKSDDSEDDSKVGEEQGSESGSGDFEPSCETDETYRQKESLLLDEKCKEYVYLNVPKPNLNNIVVPYKKVQETLSLHYADLYRNVSSSVHINKAVSDFKKKNEKYISLLTKEFEMRKAAKVYSKGRIADTGEIDIAKLPTFRFDDNIFRKMMIVPKGKNHGLILLLDCSGSMNANMAGSIEQILILSMFCRKVNIPFEVYGFNNNQSDGMIPGFNGHFQFKTRSVVLDKVQLRQYLTSTMSNVEFTIALRNMITMKEYYSNGGSGTNRFWSFVPPKEESLSSTPLIQAIVACGYLMKDFRRRFNLDLSNLIIVHDGEADPQHTYIKNHQDFLDRKHNAEAGINTYLQNVFLTDPEHKFQVKLQHKDNRSYTYLDAWLQWFSKMSQSKVFGFFILPGGNSWAAKNAIVEKYTYEDGKRFDEKYPFGKFNREDQRKNLMKKLRSDKFLVSHNEGYEEFYLIVGGKGLVVEDDELEIEGKVTSSKLKNAFIEMNRKKQVNRVLVSRFIQGMAA